MKWIMGFFLYLLAVTGIMAFMMGASDKDNAWREEQDRDHGDV
jgi:hypothetical protein